MSDSPPERDVEWTAAGADAAWKHLQRVWRLADEIGGHSGEEVPPQGGGEEALALQKAVHRAIRDITDGIESFAFNKSVAKLYELTGIIAKADTAKTGTAAKREAALTLARLMTPMTPHLAEEIWSHLGQKGLVSGAPWPLADQSLLVDDSVTLPIQINGKRRAEITVSKTATKEAIEDLVMSDEKVKAYIGDAAPKKLIVVPGRIVNVVV